MALTKVKGSGLATGAATESLVGIDDNATSTAITIDASENVLVGASTYEGSATTNASSVYIAPSGFVSANVTNDFGMQVNRTGTDGALINLRKNGADVGSIGNTSWSDEVSIYTAGKSGATFSSGGFILTDGNGNYVDNTKDVGHASYRIRDTYIGGNIYLGGTGAANALDDYEEGTWIPNPIAGFSSFTVNSAKYTKIGDLVTINFWLYGASPTTAGVKINGLPYSTSIYSNGVLDCSAFNGYNPHCRVRAGSGEMWLFKENDQILKGNDLGTGHLIGTITYRV